MTDQRKIGISIPSYNRSDMTVESFINVYEDERISEITIVDDDSDLVIFEDLKNRVKYLPKVKLFQNKKNRDCYANKATSLSYANSEWSILLDSDNKIDESYIDKIFAIENWFDDTIYTPDFAFPNFDFHNYSGLLITKENVSEYVDKPMFETMLNAANYFVNRQNYIDVWDETTDPVTSDSIYMILKWLEVGNRLQVVNGLKYFHRVHNGSHYQNEKHRTPDGFHESILNKLKLMS